MTYENKASLHKWKLVAVFVKHVFLIKQIWRAILVELLIDWNLKRSNSLGQKNNTFVSRNAGDEKHLHLGGCKNSFLPI